MPLVKIHLRKGKSPEYIRAVADGVHAALAAHANVPADDRFQLIHEYGADDIIAHPSYAGVTRTADLIVVEITLNAGRTLEIKKELYAGIARRLEEDPGVRPDDVLVNLVEVAKENWSFGRGLATYG
ncbi:MAG TPA: tautomerase family protein [Thermoanaerobaculia bacterium]|jgi:phenylpyruvate tautomerase PptA (4-oxalocrotonate tautomerase family)